MTARHLLALVGLRTGRAPACSHVSAGGGLYAIDFRGHSAPRGGFAIAGGVDVPTGGRGVDQLDVTVHLTGTRNTLISSDTAVPVLNLTVGWASRF